jgi:hypothetical protein
MAMPEAPAYRVPLPSLIGFAVDLLIGRRRSFVRDGRTVMGANERHARRVEGLEHVPCLGSFILVMNHYSRRGLRPYHCAMAVNVAVAQRRPGEGQSFIRWAFTSEYLGRRLGPMPIPLSLIRWVFRRVALVYGFAIIARRQELVMGRAASLRDLARTARHTPVGLTPEGLASSGRLVEPPPGSGLLLAALVHGGVPLLPVGIWEDGPELHIRFGPPFPLDLQAGVARTEQDRLASERVMLAVGRLLPREYRGAYTARLEG